MQLLIPEKPYPKIQELYGATEALSVTVSGADGTTLQTPSVTTVTGDLVIDEAAGPGDNYLIISDGMGLEPGWYLPESAWGEIPVEIVTYDDLTGRAYLRSPLMVHLATGITIRPVTAKFTIQIPTTYTGDLVYVQYSSALRSQRESCLVNSYEFISPFDLFREIPRLQGQQINRPEILDVPALAIADLRGRLWADGLKLDNCQISSKTLPFLRAWVKSYLTEQGIDILGGDVDRMDAWTRYSQDLATEYKNLVSAKIWKSQAELNQGTVTRSGWRARV